MSDTWILSTTDLAALGLDDKAIRRLVQGGQLVRVRRGYYRRPVPSDDQARQNWPLGEAEARHRFLMEATYRTMAAGSVFSHVSAATLHGLPVPARMLDRACILRHGSGSGAITRTSHRTYAPLPPEDVTEKDGLPVTTLVRTVVDLARALSYVDAVAVGDAALALGLQRAQLLNALGRPRPNNAKARAALNFADPASESPGESRCRATMRLAGLPIPTLQFIVRDGRGVEVARSDFAWEDLGVVGEYDGLVKYGRLLRPGQALHEVLVAEKRREQNIRRCDWWIGRWIESDLRNIHKFREDALLLLRSGRRG